MYALDVFVELVIDVLPDEVCRVDNAQELLAALWVNPEIHAE